MDSGILTKYSASAGSGKTYKLTAIYLSKLFTFRSAYKRILAVTFTNKAAADMKRKILKQLFSIASGERSDMSEELSADLGLSNEKLASEAKLLLHLILHDYSGFSVGTIDSFFQKVLKAFTREIGLQQGYIIEIDHSMILSQAVEKTLADTASDKELRNWITSYTASRIEEGRSWNLKEDIVKLSDEIFREKFRLLGEEERSKLRNRDFLTGYAADLKSLRSVFEKKLAGYADSCRKILEEHSVTDTMFLRGGSGGVGTLLKIMKNGPLDGVYKPLSNTLSQVLVSPPVWTKKAGPAPELRAALDDGFEKIFIEALRYYIANFESVNTVIFITENLFILGILANILDNVRLITSSENKFLLSDAGELLWLIIKDDQTPFIYEKAGNIYEHFMIDEFQDTSLIQWNNFRPLIENSLAGGHNSLVVGDTKQSIYRWRNSDWKIFGSLLQKQFPGSGLKTEFLDTNWRSRKNIVAFNNTIFSVLPKLIDDSDRNVTGTFMLGDIYKDTRQKCALNREGGFVRLEFLEEEEKSFKENSLNRLPGIIEHLQENGYSASDIGILVRTNREGADVLNTILEYRSAADGEKREKYNYNVISNESLLLSGSPAVGFIISLLSLLLDPEDNMSMALMLRNWLLSTGKDPLEADLADIDNESDRVLPEGYTDILKRLKNLPLFETIETIIRDFELGNYPENTAFLNSFQDLVLESSATASYDTASFLEWWKTTGIGKAVILSDRHDSIRVMTIHKSKGLEFKVVILPFISWNLGHGHQPPVMWLNPAIPPFNNLHIVPVRYKSAMQYSYFAEDYFIESYYALVDNLNLLYVACTRAVDCLYGFIPSGPKSGTIASALFQAFHDDIMHKDDRPGIKLSEHFDGQKSLFSLGEIPGYAHENLQAEEMKTGTGNYFVNNGISGLHLRFRGENWLLKKDGESEKKLNYGRLMHEVFESVFTPDDIAPSIEKMVLDGRIPSDDREEIEKRVAAALSRKEVRDWFKPGLKVMNEAEILTTDGTTQRPDRIIIEGEKVTIVDFKFGTEKKEYIKQLNNYRSLLLGMGFADADAYLWYVDSDRVVKV